MSAPRKPKNRVRGCATHPTSAARAVYALWWFTDKERPSETRFSDGLCRLSRVCRPKATHAVADLRKARDSLCGKDRVRGCATHPMQRPSESVFGRSGIYARRFYNETKQEIRIVAGVGWVLAHHSHAVSRAWWVETHPTLTVEAPSRSRGGLLLFRRIGRTSADKTTVCGRTLAVFYGWSSSSFHCLRSLTE